MFNHVPKNGKTRRVRDGQYVLIAPTPHCRFYRIPEHEDLIVGELDVGNPTFPIYEQLFSFFDYYLKKEKNDFKDTMPRVQYYTMGKNEWATADSWPPKEATAVTFYLQSNGHANSLFGNGVLSQDMAGEAASDSYTYDPMNPVPALGGGVCCNAGAALGGSYDQRGIEARADVLVYTSELMEEDLQITGSIHTNLYVSSDDKDTDFTVKIVDVYPDGTAYKIDDTIFRARYRDGYDRKVFMVEGEG